MIEAILLWASIIALVITEVAGFALRRLGFITISEQARKTRALRVAVSALFVVGLLWWQVHSVR